MLPRPYRRGPPSRRPVVMEPGAFGANLLVRRATSLINGLHAPSEGWGASCYGSKLALLLGILCRVVRRQYTNEVA